MADVLSMKYRTAYTSTQVWLATQIMLCACSNSGIICDNVYQPVLRLANGTLQSWGSFIEEHVTHAASASGFMHYDMHSGTAQACTCVPCFHMPCQPRSVRRMSSLASSQMCPVMCNDCNTLCACVDIGVACIRACINM